MRDPLAIRNIPFTKMQGLGNDFVVVAASDLRRQAGSDHFLEAWRSNLPSIAKTLCNRRYGIGADGLILVVDLAKEPELGRMLNYPGWEQCQLAWTYTNSDGSPADMCGNGLRCLALYAAQRKLVSTSDFLVATYRRPIAVSVPNGEAITVDLGPPVLKPVDVPLAGSIGDKFVARKLPQTDVAATCVSMGNPHCVVFLEPGQEVTSQFGACSKEPVFPETYARLAQQIQLLPLFPKSCNVEFALVENPDAVRVFVWERGSGPTLACASGAAATVVAGVLEGRLNRKATVRLPGGDLAIQWSEQTNHVTLTGPAIESFSGTVDIEALSIDLQTCLTTGVA